MTRDELYDNFIKENEIVIDGKSKYEITGLYSWWLEEKIIAQDKSTDKIVEWIIQRELCPTKPHKETCRDKKGYVYKSCLDCWKKWADK